MQLQQGALKVLVHVEGGARAKGRASGAEASADPIEEEDGLGTVRWMGTVCWCLHM